MTNEQYNALAKQLERIELELGSTRATTIDLQVKIIAMRKALGQKGIDWDKLDANEGPAVYIAQANSDAGYLEYWNRYKKAVNAAKKRKRARKK
jgi:hypothetical protein